MRTEARYVGASATCAPSCAVRWLIAVCLLLTGALNAGVKSAHAAAYARVGLPSAATPSAVHFVQADALTQDSHTGARLWLPPEAQLDPQVNPYRGGSGRNYKLGNMIITVMQFDAKVRSIDDLYTTFTTLPNRVIDRSQTSKSSDRLSIAGVEGGSTYFWIDAVESAGQIRGLSIVISRANASGAEFLQTRRTARRIQSSFQPFPGSATAEPAIAAAPAAPEPPQQQPPPPQRPSTPAAQARAEPPAPAAPAPTLTPTRAGEFDQYLGGDLTGDVLLESKSGAKFSQTKCAETCIKSPRCRAYSSYGNGRCVLRSKKGELRAGEAGVLSGVRVEQRASE